MAYRIANTSNYVKDINVYESRHRNRNSVKKMTDQVTQTNLSGYQGNEKCDKEQTPSNDECRHNDSQGNIQWLCDILQAK